MFKKFYNSRNLLLAVAMTCQALFVAAIAAEKPTVINVKPGKNALANAIRKASSMNGD